MLTIFKDKMSDPQNPEWFFDRNMRSFDLTSPEHELILKVMDRARYIGNGMIQTPIGKIRTRELKTATKLAMCLYTYPGFTFSSKGCSVRDLEKILVIPDGSLYLELDAPLPYLFQVRAKTGSGVKLTTSTDINIWYFTGRNR